MIHGPNLAPRTDFGSQNWSPLASPPLIVMHGPNLDLDSTSSWLGADIYDGGDSTSRIRVGVSIAGILSMLEIARSIIIGK